MPALREWRAPGIYTDGERFLTRNLTPGLQVYGEELVTQDGVEFRVWNPKRSKACAVLHRGISFFPINEKSHVLYLGAANGTTASHLSDIATRGMVYCVEFSKRAFFDLTDVCSRRGNMIPLFADAGKPELYKAVAGRVDVVYQDIAQRDQTGIFLGNVDAFLRAGGFGVLMVKARSIDVTARPRDIFAQAVQELKGGGLSVLESISLSPYEKDHAAIIVEKITE